MRSCFAEELRCADLSSGYSTTGKHKCGLLFLLRGRSRLCPPFLADGERRASVWADQLDPGRAKLATSKSISRHHKTSSFLACCRCSVPH